MTRVRLAPAEGHSAAAGPGFGIYLHWPFCRAKCPYCDFNSHVRPAIDQGRWVKALSAELDHFARRTAGRRVTSVFFGGGTPSLLEAESVAALLDRIAARWPLDPAVEVTLEANPTSAEAGRFAGYRTAGVNRLSLGVQALDPASLRFLGRQHDVKEALAAVALARRTFQRFSFDLIYARPRQSLLAWKAELARALAEEPGHISLYQLTIEPNTAFHGAWRRQELKLPGEGRSAALFEATQAQLADAGLPAYEISNHARPGEECRHNLLTWQGGDYVGVGPGAHGRLTLEGRRLATRQHRAPEVWLARVEAEGHATQAEETLRPGQRLEELLLMGLRTREGVARTAFRFAFGTEPESLLPAARLAALRAAGLLTLDPKGLSATAAGRQRLDALLAYLLAEVS